MPKDKKYNIKYGSQCVGYAFTYYPEIDKEDDWRPYQEKVVDTLKSAGLRNWVFQLEHTQEDKLHFQGHVNFKTKQYLHQAAKKIPGHLSIVHKVNAILDIVLD